MPVSRRFLPRGSGSADSEKSARLTRAPLLLLLLPLILGCGASSSPADLLIAQDSEPQSLDPAQMTGVGEGRIASALFEGLTRLDPGSLAPVSGVAESWEVSSDEKTWRFRLRSGSRWSDGRPVVAGDFRYAWLRLLDPATGSSNAGLLFDVLGAREFQAGETGPESVGISAPDDHTFVVTLARPVPYFPALAAFFALLPVPRRAIEMYGERWTRAGNIVTNGPFLLAEWAFYRQILLRRNDDYWDAERVKVERIRLLPISNPNTQFNLYETGGADITFSVPSAILKHLRSRQDFVHGPRLATAFLRLNVTRKPFSSRDARLALAHAVDRQTLVEHITRGGEQPADSLVPPVLPGYTSREGPEYRPDLAREHLGRAGFAGGAGFPAITLLYPAKPAYAALATVLQHRLSQVLGIDVHLDPREWKVYISAMKRLEYDVALGQWIGDYPDPSTFLGCFLSDSGNNRTGWKNTTYDALLARAEELQEGETPAEHRARRLELFSDAEHLLVSEEAPIVPLYHPTVRYMVSSRVSGFVPNGMGLMSFADLSAEER